MDFNGDGLDWVKDDPVTLNRLKEAIELSLPSSYDFEIPKSLARIFHYKAKRVCLQLPEGLLFCAEALALIIEEFSPTVEDVFLIGDVTYGACCVDDIKARFLNCDFLIHYAHSCLIPLDSVDIPCLYVFVEIRLNVDHLVESILATLPKELVDQPKETPIERNVKSRSIAILGSIQYSSVIHSVAKRLQEIWGNDTIIIPQRFPLTAGETLGCTSAILAPETKFCIFVADGRFHLESAMIQNPHTTFYRYDPSQKRMYSESYDYHLMQKMRRRAIEKARGADAVIIILSTLGRQGSVGICEYIQSNCPKIETHVVLISELSPQVLSDLSSSGEKALAFVQIGCPRLSIDWGDSFGNDQSPVLNSQEAYIAFGNPLCQLDNYAMDYFATDGGLWSNYGRGGSRNGSLGDKECDIILSKAARLREKWLKLKFETQNAKGSSPPTSCQSFRSVRL